MIEYEYTKNAFRDWIWKVIGKDSKLQWGGTADGVLEEWTPNNVRRLIITPDVIIVGRFNHSSKSGASNKIAATPLKNTEPVMYNRLFSFGTINGGTELDNAVQDFRNTMSAIMGIKEGVRVFSNIEDLIIIPYSTKGPDYDFPPEIKDVFAEVCQQIPAKRRFRGLTVYTGPEFTDLMDVVEQGKLLSRDELKESENFQQITWVGADNREKEIEDGTKEDYRLYYSLRPQYYRLDEQGGYLYNYFTKDKEEYIREKHLGSVEEVEEEVEEVEDEVEGLEEDATVESGWEEQKKMWVDADLKLRELMKESVDGLTPIDDFQSGGYEWLDRADTRDKYYGEDLFACICTHYKESVDLILDLYNDLPLRLFVVQALVNILEDDKVKSIIAGGLNTYGLYQGNSLADSFNYPVALKFMVEGGRIDRFDEEVLKGDSGLYTLDGFTKGFEEHRPVMAVVVDYYKLLVEFYKEYGKLREKHNLTRS